LNRAADQERQLVGRLKEPTERGKQGELAKVRAVQGFLDMRRKKGWLGRDKLITRGRGNYYGREIYRRRVLPIKKGENEDTKNTSLRKKEER